MRVRKHGERWKQGGGKKGLREEMGNGVTMGGSRMIGKKWLRRRTGVPCCSKVEDGVGGERGDMKGVSKRMRKGKTYDLVLAKSSRKSLHAKKFRIFC